jgi:dolichyl-diphosphooligosaccharide---protein glycosyltransferase
MAYNFNPSVKLISRPDSTKEALKSGLSFINANKSALRIIILSLIALMGFGQRLFSIIRYESIIHEFDPWFNYRATLYLVKNGWYEFLNWYDETAWYPLGRSVGGTVYPGIMVTSAVFHYIFNKILAFPVEIRDVCVFLAPVCSGLTAYAAYLLTKELKDSAAGLIAAGFIVICPGYISRSVAGSYDNEAIAIFLMVACFYLWIKASKNGSSIYGAACAMSYFYMVSSWGGYSFVINMIPLHVFGLLCMGRYSHELYRSYSTFYVIGTLASMTVPFVGFQPTFTSEHMPALGVFGLLQLCAAAQVVRGYVDSDKFKLLIKISIMTITAVGFGLLAALSLAGMISPLGGRVYSLLDTGYAAKHIPIIASVSEHQPTSWGSLYMDFQWLFYLFPAGIWWCLRQRRNEHIFVILYGTFATYFAGVMVRLILTLAPIVCVSAALACSQLLDSTFKSQEKDSHSQKLAAATESVQAIDDNDENKDNRGGGFQMSTGTETKVGKFKSLDWITKTLIVAPIVYHMIHYVYHSVLITQMAYSSPSVIISSRTPAGKEMIIDDFREAYYWLRRNTAKDSRILSWWDYGYQIAGFSDRTTIVDNNTWNNTHIATVGKVMATSESVSYKTMRQLDANYILVISGAASGYSGDDVNKFLWMVKISAGVYPKDVQEKDYYNAHGSFSIDPSASAKTVNSILYKTVYHKMGQLGGPSMIDNVRQTQIADPDPKLSVLEEVFSSERFIVRIYKVKNPDTLGRPLIR